MRDLTLTALKRGASVAFTAREDINGHAMVSSVAILQVEGARADVTISSQMTSQERRVRSFYPSPDKDRPQKGHEGQTDPEGFTQLVTLRAILPSLPE